jgi:hypothetical protein
MKETANKYLNLSWAVGNVTLTQYEEPMKKVCKENPRIQLIGERNRCDIQIQVRLSHMMDREEQM